MEPQAIIDILVKVINGGVHKCFSDAKEPHEFAEMVFAKTAKEQWAVIGQKRIRETTDQINQRERLTNPTTAAAVNPALAYVEELRRTDGVSRQARFANTDRLATLEEDFSNYYAGQSLQDFIFQAVKTANEYDPNAWLVFERTPPQADGLYKMYPVIVSSEQAVDWKYNEFGILEYLVFSENEYISSAVTEGAKLTKEVNHFYLYTAGFAAFAQYMGEESEPRYEDEYFTTPDAENYAIWIFPTGTTETPAERLGAYLSELDINEPCELLYEAARGHLKDLMSLKSSHDLNESLHMYPKLFQYVKRCNAVDQDGATCESGYYGGQPDRVCRACNGTGKIVHGSEQDAVTLAFPETKEEFVDLAQVAHYMALPMDVFVNQQERLKYLSTIITYVVYSQEQVDHIQPGVTATEIAINYNRIYNKLAPLAEKWGQLEAKAYRVGMQYYGAFADGDGYYVQFPMDFAMKTESELLKDLADAKTAGAPFAVIKAIQDALLKKKYRDNAAFVADQLAFDAIKPFADKTGEDLAMILSSRSKTDPQRVAWENWQDVQNTILDTLEPGQFSQMPLARRKQLVKEQVDTIISEMPAAQDPTGFNPAFQQVM